MSSQDMSSSALEQMRVLALRVEQLADMAQRLLDENRRLRHSQEQLSTERATLLAKNEQARSRVEAMIQRLKSLEQNARANRSICAFWIVSIWSPVQRTSAIRCCRQPNSWTRDCVTCAMRIAVPRWTAGRCWWH